MQRMNEDLGEKVQLRKIDMATPGAKSEEEENKYFISKVPVPALQTHLKTEADLVLPDQIKNIDTENLQSSKQCWDDSNGILIALNMGF